MQNHNLTNLYNNSNKIFVLSNNSLIIGIIKIEKLNIEYPVFSYCSSELLKVGVCRFYGPNPNSSGNICIAGHNYNDANFFSKLSSLEIGDKINLANHSGKFLDYYIYNKYESEASDISCTNQDTNGKLEITLVTCTNFNNKRLVIKAKK